MSAVNDRTRPVAGDLVSVQDLSIVQHPDAETISGRVKHKATGLPVEGVSLTWVAMLGGALICDDKPVFLGAGRTGRNGEFTIRLQDDAEAHEVIRFLEGSSSSWAAVTIADDGVYGKARLFPRVTSGVVIAAETDGSAAPLDIAQVQSLGEYLAVNRLLTAGALRGQLATPWPDSPVAKWPLSMRLDALKGFDGEMKNTDHSGGGGRDQLLDFDVLYSGELLGSVTGDIVPGGTFDQSWGRKTNLSLYRDYLRGIWVSAATFAHKKIYSFDAAKSDLEKQLNNRLHQNFKTPIEAQSSAAALLADILKAALITGEAQGGFGKAAAQVPAAAEDESADAYLGRLIEFSGVSRIELRNRFRVDFDPASDAMTSPVQLNIDALRLFLSDTHQVSKDPYPATPNVNPERSGLPIIFSHFAGTAPFYLQYEEWLDRQRPFYGENAYDIRRTVPVFPQWVRDEFVSRMGNRDFDASKEFTEAAHSEFLQSAEGLGARIVSLFGLIDQLNHAVWQVDAADLGGALTTIGALESASEDLLRKLLRKGWYKPTFDFENGEPPREITLPSRAAMPSGSIDELSAIEKFFQPREFRSYYEPGTQVARTLEIATIAVHWLYYARQIMLPFLRSRVAHATGNYAEALRHLGNLTGVQIGVAEAETGEPYAEGPYLHRLESLPYTALVKYNEKTGRQEESDPVVLSLPWGDTWLLSTLNRGLQIPDCEARHFKLAQGRAMLGWAEQLFRTDEPSNIRRARELFKGVLFLHSVDPGTIPAYPKEGDPIVLLLELIGNPAIRAQVERARYGLFLIEEGLNAYGWREDMVPILRFRPLKDASDSLAAAAKSAQDDFIAYTDRFEQAQLDRMHAALLVEKAKAAVSIAGEQVAIAQRDVELAREQVKAVEKQIEQKQEEIEDHDSFFGQFEDYLSGAKTALEGLTKAGKSSGGEKAMTQLAAVGGSGAMVLGGMAAFVYVSWVSMEGMETEANRRADEIKRLRNVALPAAKAQVTLRIRGVSIATHQKRIAEADMQYAKAVVGFNHDRFLSVETWSKLAGFAEQLMAYYVDNAARLGWLAERALAFEQARTIDIIGKNYLPRAMRGLTGPDALQADLAALENSRLLGIKLTMPVQHSLSLAREFPIAFGALKARGRCSFATEEARLRTLYPGLFGFRLRTVSVAALTTGAQVIHGTLRNRGISSVGQDGGGSEQVLIRFPDALPISEFNMREDMDAFGLPGEALLQFEGSGFTTGWDIALASHTPPAPGLLDVVITFDGYGFYNDDMFVADETAADNMNRTILFAGSSIDPEGMRELQEGAASKLTLDLAGFAGKREGEVRTITNIGLIWLGEGATPVTLTAQNSGETAAVPFNNGIAASNAPPFDSSNGPMPLNAFHGVAMDQAFALDFDDADLSKLADLVIVLEYSGSM